MNEFEREHGDWSLCQAVRYTARQEALAMLHRDLIEAAAAGIQHEPIHWWHWADPPPPPPAPGKDSAPPPAMIKTEDGRQFLLDYGIETEFLHKLYDGRLRCWGRPGSPLAEAVRVPPGAVVGIKSWWPGGGILRLANGETLYDARIERIVRQRRPANPRAVEEWLLSQPPMSEDKTVDAAEEYFGVRISRDSVIRPLRRKHGLQQGAGRKVRPT